MIKAFRIGVFNAPTVALCLHLVGFFWLKGNLVHSGHLDIVRGRQATVVIRMSELLGDRRYRSDMRLRI